MRKFQIIILCMIIITLSSCTIRSNKFEYALNPNSTNDDIVNVYSEIRDHNNHQVDVQIPHDHLLFFMDSYNKVFSFESIYYSINSDFEDGEYIFTTSKCDVNGNKLECSTIRGKNNRRDVLEESLPLDDILNMIEENELSDILQIAEDYFLFDTSIPLKVIGHIKFFDESTTNEGLENTIFIDNEVALDSGEYEADGFYLGFYLYPLANNIDGLYIIYIKFK